ncbi:hypothetical protein [uncultured Dubosiella sp.]|uniref:hypothetical protein n=1 Tax=uncultured Dubosiella sp. TaxID=1937011 RepID=UPI0025AF0508|nr:hypothetical protein [uncultured Dubosiella sp.]
MVGKLLKYDLKNQARRLVPYCLIALATALIVRLLSLGHGPVFSTLQTIAISVDIVLLIGCVLMPLISGWTYMIRSMYKDEGYLTNTLPVSRSSVYIAQWLSGMLGLLLCLATAALGLWIAFYSQDYQMVINGIVMTGKEALGYSSTSALLASVFIVYYFEMGFAMTAGYAGIVLGYRCWKDKPAKAVLFGLGLYFLGSVLSVAILFVYGLFDPSVMELFRESAEPGVTMIKSIFMLGTVYYIVVSLALDAIALKALGKGINLE